MYSKKITLLHMSCLICFISSGCTDPFVEQYRRNSDQMLNDFRVEQQREKEEAIEKYLPLIIESAEYVKMNSTNEMKEHISKGELVIGMNFYEVMVSLSATGFKYGVPYKDAKYTGIYGTVETFYIAGFNPYYASSNPKYILTLTNGILTDIYER